MKRWLLSILIGLGTILHAAESRQILFNGQDLKGWTVTDFGGHGPASVESNSLIIEPGAALSGVHWTNPLPKTNYEIRLEAKKLEGSDFFCGLTFPVRDSFCTWIVGGWGGGIVGLSSIDSLDASENETSKGLFFENNRWYRLRLRVFPEHIQAWIDEDKIIDVGIKNRRIDLRPGDIEMSRPFGIATYQTKAAIRGLEVRSTDAPKKVVFIAGNKSHGPGEHDYEKGLKLLKESLESSTNAPLVETELHLEGWPEDPTTLTNASTIVLYSDGSDRKEDAHPLLQGDHLKLLANEMKRGAGLVALHYTVFVPKAKAGDQFLDWLGGYFDYETGLGPNHWYSKIELRDYDVRPASKHPITSGLGPFSLKEEYYFQMRFRENDKRWTPILTFDPEAKDPAKVVAWAVERADGGRGFASTGGHFHKNWWNDSVRKLVHNAILWSAKAEVPPQGVVSTIPADTK